MLTDAGYPATSVENLTINTFWDGLFHATHVRPRARTHPVPRPDRRDGADGSVAGVPSRNVRRSTRLPAGTLLIGFGLFNLVDGIVDHHLLGFHHVNETVPREQGIFWDPGFLTWGAARAGELRLDPWIRAPANNLLAIRLRNSSSERWNQPNPARRTRKTRGLYFINLLKTCGNGSFAKKI